MLLRQNNKQFKSIPPAASNAARTNKCVGERKKNMHDETRTAQLKNKSDGTPDDPTANEYREEVNIQITPPMMNPHPWQRKCERKRKVPVIYHMLNPSTDGYGMVVLFSRDRSIEDDGGMSASCQNYWWKSSKESQKELHHNRCLKAPPPRMMNRQSSIFTLF